MAALPERRLLLLLASVQFVNILDFVIIQPLGPHFIAELGATPAELGLLVSSYTIAAAVSGLSIGTWVNARPRRTALLISFALFGVATLLCGFAHHYATLLAARTIAGLAGGPSTSLVLAIVADATPPDRRGRALSTVQSAFSVASVLGVPLGLYLANWGSWRSPFLVLGAMALVIWVAILRWLPPFDEHLAKRTENEPSMLETMREVLSDRQTRMAYVTHALVMIGGFSIIPFLAPFLVNNRGVGADQLGLFYLSGGLITFVNMQFVGRWTDRFGSVRMYMVFALLFGLNLQFILFAPLQGLWLLPLFALFMVFNSGRMVPMMTLYSKIPPPRLRGAFMSYLSTVQHLGSGVGVLVAGLFLTLDPVTGRLNNISLVAEAFFGVTLLAVFLAGTLKTAPAPST